MSVATVPGAIALARMPSGASSAAIARVIASSALFADTYIETNWPCVNTPAVMTLMIDACSLARRWGSASCTKNNGPRRFASQDFESASVVIVPMGIASGLAALLTTMSTPPNSATVAATSAASCSGSPTWVGTDRADPPSSRISVTAASHAPAFRLATTTFAPIAANPCAIARPMPRLPPVTIAVLAVRSKVPSSADLSMCPPWSSGRTLVRRWRNDRRRAVWQHRPPNGRAHRTTADRHRGPGASTTRIIITSANRRRRPCRRPCRRGPERHGRLHQFGLRGSRRADHVDDRRGRREDRGQRQHRTADV